MTIPARFKNATIAVLGRNVPLEAFIAIFETNVFFGGGVIFDDLPDFDGTFYRQTWAAFLINSSTLETKKMYLFFTRFRRPSGHKSQIQVRISHSYIKKPVVHTRDGEPVAQVVRRWLELQEVLGSNPTGGHSFVVA